MTDTPGLTQQEYDEHHRQAIIRPPGEAPDVWVRHDYMKTARLIETLNELCAVQDDRDKLDETLGHALANAARWRAAIKEIHDKAAAAPTGTKGGYNHRLIEVSESWLDATSSALAETEGGDQ